MGGFLRSDLSSTQHGYLKADGSVDTNNYMDKGDSGCPNITTQSVTINGYSNTLNAQEIVIGGWAVGVRVYGQIRLASFPNSNSFASSNKSIFTSSTYYPPCMVDLLIEGRHSGSSSEAKHVFLTTTGYVYVHGISSHQLGSSTTINPTYYNDNYVKVGGCYFYASPYRK
jgi:hypothetical protein